MWPNPQFPVDLVTFTEGIFNEKIHFVRSVGKFLLGKILSVVCVRTDLRKGLIWDFTKSITKKVHLVWTKYVIFALYLLLEYNKIYPKNKIFSQQNIWNWWRVC